MPTATSFIALGKGNGLPTCAFRKTFNPATHSGLYTLQEIMQLYWNTSSIEVTATTFASQGGPPPEPLDQTLDFTTEPFERVCNRDDASQPFRLANESADEPGSPPTENQNYIGFDESSEKYFLNIKEIVFSGIDDEGFIISGVDPFPETPGRAKAATDSSGVGKTWSIDCGALQGTKSATIKFNFYTYD